MKPEAQRIAIAEACGWTPYKMANSQIQYWRPNQGEQWSYQAHQLPNYLNDLNAMHEAEKVMGDVFSILSCEYDDWLTSITGNDQTWRATAAQRAEAFLRTLNLWTDDA